MVYAAGILILASYKDEVYVLLGRDHYNTYSDFGGKGEQIDKNNALYTAARETYEETCGCMYSIQQFYSRITRVPMIRSLSYTNKDYFMYVMFDTFDTAVVDDFNTVYSVIKKQPHMSKFKEKNTIKWFKLQDVLDLKIPLRNVFRRTIESHKQTILRIASEYKSRNSSYKYGRRS